MSTFWHCTFSHLVRKYSINIIEELEAQWSSPSFKELLSGGREININMRTMIKMYIEFSRHSQNRVVSSVCREGKILWKFDPLFRTWKSNIACQ